MTRRRMPDGTGHLAAIAAALLAACSPGAEKPGAAARLQHLLATPGTATLGSETRPCAACSEALVLRGDFESPAALPEYVALPGAMAPGKRVVLSRRVWERSGRPDPGGADVRTGAVSVDGAGARPRARLRDLGDVGASGAVSAQVVAFPLPDGAAVGFRAPVVPPAAGVLEFGFGIREEAWGRGAAPVRFRVSARDAAGGERELFSAALDPDAAADQRWFDRRVDLSDLAGQRVTLVFRGEWEPGTANFSLPVFSAPLVYPAEAATDRPNVLLISLDTLRARSLGTYGYVRDTSPFLDSLARRAAVFERAITASVTTSPSHMSIFTGLYPVNHGIRRALHHKLPTVRTLAERLRREGYRTAAFTENGYLVRGRGFGDGFDEYTENHGEGKRAPGEVRRTFGQARRWLAAKGDQPFFLFLHTYEVHSPYDPEAPYAELFRGDAAPGPEAVAIREARDDYDREIRIVDDALRALFEDLEATGLAESTLAVVLADHGEEFAEHGAYQHGAAVYEESLRVPLIFWGPGRIPAARHRAAAVSLIDVAPTILDLLGLAVPEGLDGSSLKGVLMGGAPPPERTLFSEARAPTRWLAPMQREVWNPPLFAVHAPDAKYIVHQPQRGQARPMLRFDLASDPGEATPLPVEPARARAVEELVAGYRKGRAGAAAADAEDAEGVSPDLRERLRSLGYAE